MAIGQARSVVRPAAIAAMVAGIAAAATAITSCDWFSSSSSRSTDQGSQTAGMQGQSQAQTSGAGVIAIDCGTQVAYVPLLNSPDPQSCNGRLAVIDLSVNPDRIDPRKKIVVLNHRDTPSASAVDTADKLVVVVSGNEGTGYVDVIDETSNTLVAGSPFVMPAGVQPGDSGQVVYDAGAGLAIISVEAGGNCAANAHCTGFITFSPTAHSFGKVTPANYPATFAFNGATRQIVVASDDDDAGQVGVVEVGSERACVLADVNLGGDITGVSIDVTTDIAVLSIEDGAATVINLNGSTAESNPAAAPACTIHEGGAAPNSVKVAGLPEQTAASAINPATHQAFLVENGGAGVSLLDLPAAPVTQLGPDSIAAPAISTIPDDPEGENWETQSEPYAVAVDQCRSLGLVVNADSSGDFGATYLAQVDLKMLKRSPKALGSALPAGNCAGTGTTHSCRNGNGVVFYPLPPESEKTTCSAGLKAGKAKRRN